MAKRSNTKRQEGKQQVKQSLKDGVSAVKDIALGAVTLNPARLAKGLVKGAKARQDSILGLGKVLFNHPEWYTHYDTASMININLAAKQYNKYPQFFTSINSGTGSATRTNYSYAMPSMARLRVQLTTPSGDSDGWKAGIRLLYQQLRTANSGRVNYQVTDLEKYVQNVRALVAIEAWLNRLYRLTYTFRSTNSNIPKGFIELCGVDFDDIMANAANLFSYIQRFVQQVEVTFPLKLDYFSRAQWMFGSVFADSDGDKPSYYLFTFNQHYNVTQNGGSVIDPNGGILYYTSAGADGAYSKGFVNIGYAAGLQKYSELMAQCDKIKNALIDDTGMSTIAGDVIKAFGSNAFRNFTPCGINEEQSIVYDEYALSQIQNADVIHIAIPEWDSLVQDTSQDDNTNAYYAEEIEDDGWITSELKLYGWVRGSNFQGGNVRQPIKFDTTQGQDEAILDRYNNKLFNWHKSDIQPGELMSITRLSVSGAVKLSDGTGTGVGAGFILGFNIFGTEVVTGMDALLYGSTKAGADSTYDPYTPMNRDPRYVSIAGFIANRFNGEGVDTVTPAAMLLAATQFWLWANLNSAPAFSAIHITYSTDTGSSLYGIAPLTMDWDVFASASSQNIALYLSYANQSMLYAGSSQNQSNSQVYLTTSTKGAGKR